MSAERLREAADRLDVLASAATPGPWWYDPTKVNSVDGEESVFAGLRGLRATTVTSTGPGDDPQSMSDAAYIATMHPGVGKALAAWLRDESFKWETTYLVTQRPSSGVGEPPAVHCGNPEAATRVADYHARRALAVADKILGGAE